jgi:hypothetical protein
MCPGDFLTMAYDNPDRRHSVHESVHEDHHKDGIYLVGRQGVEP